jgi:predicted nucleic acid-binding Zn ribbon protein
MATRLKDKKDKQETNWKGLVYYPDGTDNDGYGIQVESNGFVWFPKVINPDKPVPPEMPRIAVQTKAETCDKGQQVVQSSTPQLSVTKHCDICGNPLQAGRSDARYCSPKCRQTASRKNRQLALLEV